jgi:hypothetical protein
MLIQSISSRCFLAFTFAVVLPVFADEYRYFYPCDSGVVDCGSFQKHWYGDFGLAGASVNLDPFGSGPGSYYPSASNVLGETIGNITWPFQIPVPGYGVSGGQPFCIPLDGACVIDIDGVAPVDINNNGTFLFTGLNDPFFNLIGFGSTMSRLELPLIPYLGGRLLFVSAGGLYGINDANQILANVVVLGGTAGGDEVEGVLSPFQVSPEPSS